MSPIALTVGAARDTSEKQKSATHMRFPLCPLMTARKLFVGIMDTRSFELLRERTVLFDQKIIDSLMPKKQSRPSHCDRLSYHPAPAANLQRDTCG